MRVLMLNPSFSAGAFQHRLCNALADAGAEVDLWSGPHVARVGSVWEPARYRQLTRFYRRTQERSWRHGPLRPMWRLARLAGHVASVARLLAEAPRYDIVHGYFLAVPALDEAWFPLVRHRTRIAFHVHNLYPHDADPAAVRPRYQRLYQACHLLFAHTDATVRGLVDDFGVDPARIVQLPLGHVCELIRPDMVPDPEALGLGAHTEPLVLMLGEVRRNKGVDTLIRAAAVLRDRGVRCRVLIAGRQPAGDPREYRDLAKSLGVADIVEFRPYFIPEAEVPAYLAAAAVVAFPYREIAQSAGALYAVSHGRPIVAARVGGLVDLVESGGAGLLVPPDDPASLADALATILADRTRAEAMGRAGREWARHALAWEPIARTTIDAYRRTLA